MIKASKKTGLFLLLHYQKINNKRYQLNRICYALAKQ